MEKIINAFILTTFCFCFAFSQKESRKPSQDEAIKSSPAYAEVLLRKVELEAELEDLLMAYTENHPKIQQTKYEVSKLNQELEKFRAFEPNKIQKMSLSLGKLVVRKVQIEVDLWLLLQKYTEEEEIVKRTRKKLTVFENAIKEILNN
ncbi:MAG: hypothetical protein N2Z23_07850 [Pyrinomonadaceae bacterium]|nr:hypothetical protein [Pyrinomonadaceae bacterium]MCX7640338.1 hypothetical protein [Pyrinomonadaceae bacterium]MDW8304765.1 hypothetical protein [Acidobacteriota bacterium]